MYTQSHNLITTVTLTYETMVRSPTCRRPGPGGTQAGAAVVAIGIGSPVARLGADGRGGGGNVASAAAGRSRRSPTVGAVEGVCLTERKSIQAAKGM